MALTSKKQKLDHLFHDDGWSQAVDAWQSFWKAGQEEMSIPKNIDPKLRDVFRYMHLCTIQYFLFGT